MLTFYEYVLTISSEIQCIWRRRFSLVTVLFILNRYTLLIRQILMIIHILPWHRPDAIEVSFLRLLGVTLAYANIADVSQL